MSLINEEDPPPQADWIVTYGDMMSLLLTFFILLVSMGEIQQKKYEAMVESLRRSFGATLDSSSSGSPQRKGTGGGKIHTQGQTKAGGETKGGEEQEGPIGAHRRTLIIRAGRNPAIGGVIYFDENSGDLTAYHRDVLQRTANLLRGKTQKIEIRGHTSTAPLSKDGPYATHWDLAYARCLHTMECLIQLGLEAKRFRISIAGGNEPLHTEPDPLLRKENSRVEVYMLDEFVETSSSPTREMHDR